MNNLRIIVSKNRFYIWLYSIALLMPFVVNSFEVNVFISCLFLLFLLLQKGLKLSKIALISLTCLLSILIIAFISHFFYENVIYDVFKDAVYLTKPIIYLLLGYFFANKIKNKENIFKIIIFLGVLLAVLHLSKLGVSLFESNNFKISTIRYYGGKDNFLELLACSLLVLNKKNKYFNISFRFKRLTYFLLLLSFVLYFSRTMTVAFFILLLTVNGYTKLSKKALIAIIIVLASILLFYRFLFSIDIDRSAEGFEGFLYKLKIAPSEIFSSNININDPTERWDHWRAYEAKKAFDTMEVAEAPFSYAFGMGLGALVNLGFEAELGSEKMQYIPKIHNGYVYLIFKTGIIGIVIYLCFLLNLYLQSYNYQRNDPTIFTNNFISAIAIFYLFTSFIISGIYNPRDVYSIFLGALLFLQIHNKKQYENSHFRD